MCEQILPTSTITNIWRTVKRTCVLILALKGLIESNACCNNRQHNWSGGQQGQGPHAC